MAAETMYTNTDETVMVTPVVEFEDELSTPPAAIDNFDDRPEEEKAKIRDLATGLDITNTTQLISFGAAAQKQVTAVSSQMLEGVRNKDTGPVGEALNESVLIIRGLGIDELDPDKKPGIFSRLLRRAKPVALFIQKYESVEGQIEAITQDLSKHKMTLNRDIVMLDKLYDSTLKSFKELELYILALESRISEVQDVTIPQARDRAEKSDKPEDALELKQIIATKEDMERRLHDLRLTRQVTMQSLPSIRMVQENDKGLVGKIQSQIINTIPMWKQQIAVQITAYRSAQAAKATKNVSDLTNEMLERGAKSLKDANIQARKEMERGIFDVESVKKANMTLIQSIEESLKITEDGRKARKAAEEELKSCEASLKQALTKAADSHMS